MLLSTDYKAIEAEINRWGSYTSEQHFCLSLIADILEDHGESQRADAIREIVTRKRSPLGNSDHIWWAEPTCNSCNRVDEFFELEGGYLFCNERYRHYDNYMEAYTALAKAIMKGKMK